MRIEVQQMLLEPGHAVTDIQAQNENTLTHWSFFTTVIYLTDFKMLLLKKHCKIHICAVLVNVCHLALEDKNKITR